METVHVDNGAGKVLAFDWITKLSVGPELQNCFFYGFRKKAIGFDSMVEQSFRGFEYAYGILGGRTESSAIRKHCFLWNFEPDQSKIFGGMTIKRYVLEFDHLGY